VEVLRRAGFDQNIASFGSLLESLGFGMLDMNSFDSLKMQNVNLYEDKDQGYAVSINIQEGSFFISQNWLKWPQPLVACAGDDNACIAQNRFKISDVLPDSEILKIADEFIKAHNIDLGSYGNAEIMDTWRAEYDNTADKSQFYIPESGIVLYPLIVNGQSVYDQGGSKTGITVSVDYRQRKVVSVANITSQIYQASNYPAETDAAKILKIVEQGGSYWGYPVPMSHTGQSGSGSAEPGIVQPMPPIWRGEEKTIEVGTPTKEYVFFTNYLKGEANDLLVPSLVFPITKTPVGVGYFYQKYIVVPLAKELIDQQTGPTPYMTK